MEPQVPLPAESLDLISRAGAGEWRGAAQIPGPSSMERALDWEARGLVPVPAGPVTSGKGVICHLWAALNW